VDDEPCRVDVIELIAKMMIICEVCPHGMKDEPAKESIEINEGVAQLMLDGRHMRLHIDDVDDESRS
jgi:hypothetical protein